MELGKKNSSPFLKSCFVQCFYFDLNRESEMTLTVMDQDMVVDDIVGTVNVDLEEVCLKVKLMRWYTLEYKNKKAGEI